MSFDPNTLYLLTGGNFWLCCGPAATAQPALHCFLRFFGRDWKRIYYNGQIRSALRKVLDFSLMSHYCEVWGSPAPQQDPIEFF